MLPAGRTASMRWSTLRGASVRDARVKGGSCCWSPTRMMSSGAQTVSAGIFLQVFHV